MSVATSATAGPRRTGSDAFGFGTSRTRRTDSSAADRSASTTRSASSCSASKATSRGAASSGGSNIGSVIGAPLGATFNTDVDWISTLTGRVGLAFDRWLVYGKGGVAWANDSYTTNFYTLPGHRRGDATRGSAGPPAPASNTPSRRNGRRSSSTTTWTSAPRRSRSRRAPRPTSTSRSMRSSSASTTSSAARRDHGPLLSSRHAVDLQNPGASCPGVFVCVAGRRARLLIPVARG